MDESNGVYLGFIENAPTLCIWDCEVFNVQPTGYQSFVFQTDNLDFIYEKAAPYYSSVGRKSIDPVVLINLL